MQFKNFAVPATALFFSLFCVVSPVLAQEEVQQADLENPTDTSDVMLVAKGGDGIVNIPLTEADLKERLSYLSSCVDVRVNGVVKGYIKTYIYQKTEKARIMLGRRLTYFPLFEEKLKEHGLPQDLKFLSVVESALNAKAVSRVGATGLWQFMPATGSDYGLRSNSAVEDRSNPVKSTDAAARYLKHLYSEFGDWALALAAYNSGPGRVNAAIRRTGSRNFWTIQRYLPEETRNYVPAFIAASYICNYYNVHGLRPYDPDMDQQITAYIRVHEGISFNDIANATGIPYTMVKELNPGFLRGYVPHSTDGHFVIVPKRVMPAFVRYLNSVSSARKYTWESADGGVNNNTLGDGRYYQTQINVSQAEHVDAFASKIGLCGDQLRTWNKMTNNFVYANQTLTLWNPVYVQKHGGGIKVEVAKPGSRPSVTNTSNTPTSPTANISKTDLAIQSQRRRSTQGDAQYQYHTVRRNESLQDVARQYATSLESLRKLNGEVAVKVGTRLKIREY
jgi:membrane-bound lytic murein transglycosylase D